MSGIRICNKNFINLFVLRRDNVRDQGFKAELLLYFEISRGLPEKKISNFTPNRNSKLNIANSSEFDKKFIPNLEAG